MFFGKKLIVFRFAVFTIAGGLFLIFLSYLFSTRQLYMALPKAETLSARPYGEYENAKPLTEKKNQAYLRESLKEYVKLFENHSWKKEYFSKNDFLIHSPWRGDQYIRLSWSGCIDMFKKVSADIIIIGASDSAYNLPLDLVQQELQKINSIYSKVLLCSRIQMSPEMLQETLMELVQTGQKAKLIIWGYGAPAANFKQYDFYKHFNVVQNRILHDNQRSPAFGFRDLVPNLKWQYSAAVKAEHKPIFLPDEVIVRKDYASYFANYLQTIPFITDDIDQQTCNNFSRARQDLQNNLSLMQSLADKVYLYLTPSTEVEYTEEASCYLPAVRALLQSFGSERVKVNTADWKWYNLDYPDYLIPYIDKENVKLYLNPNHNNYEGAKKIVPKIIQESVF